MMDSFLVVISLYYGTKYFLFLKQKNIYIYENKSIRLLCYYYADGRTRKPIRATLGPPNRPSHLPPPPRLRAVHFPGPEPGRGNQEANPSLRLGPEPDPAAELLLPPDPELVRLRLVGLQRAALPVHRNGEGSQHAVADVPHVGELEPGAVRVQHPVHELQPLR